MFKTKLRYPVRIERDFIEGFLDENQADYKAYEKSLDMTCIFPYFTGVLGFWAGCFYSKTLLGLFFFVFAGYVIGILNFFHNDILIITGIKKLCYFLESRTWRLFNLILICSFSIFSRTYIFIPLFIAGILSGAAVRFAADFVYKKTAGRRYSTELSLIDTEALKRLTDFVGNPYKRTFKTVEESYIEYKKSSGQ